ncbi:MAG TPA: AAA family ATPase [Methylomirabilota bacterium]|nr:AAA family ATPase [Methylomirabilota bacterium]
MPASRLTLVTMAGLPGAGKTTIAYALGHELGWQVIDKDMCREVLVKQGIDDDRAGKVAYELSFAHARTLLIRQQISAILDTAALHHFILDKVMEILCSTDEVLLKVILCVAERDLRNYRLRNRPYQPTSIRVDPATISDYLRYFEHLPENKLTLFTNVPILECIAKAKDYINQ